jgi:hypothetical protein
MATITRLLTVNPAFLQEIKEDNHEVRQLLHHAKASISRPRGMHLDLRQFVDLLGRLRDQIGMHFALEEAYGYFDDAIVEDPTLSHEAAELRAEHQLLFRDLCAVVEQAERLFYHETDPYRFRDVVAGLRRFYVDLEDHEAREDCLILTALGVQPEVYE